MTGFVARHSLVIGDIPHLLRMYIVRGYTLCCGVSVRVTGSSEHMLATTVDGEVCRHMYVREIVGRVYRIGDE